CSTRSTTARAVPPVAITSSTTSTRWPGRMASRCTCRTSLRYSSGYSTLVVFQGSLPALRIGTNPAPRRIAIAAPNMNPRAARPAQVRPPLPGVVDRQRPVLDRALAAGQVADLLSQATDAYLLLAAQVEGQVVVAVQDRQDPRDQVVHIAEAAGLAAVAVDGQGFAAQRLRHEVGDDAAVVDAHARRIGVEDADDPGIQPVRPLVGHRVSLCDTLRLVVAAA